MGLISRVSSRTYRNYFLLNHRNNINKYTKKMSKNKKDCLNYSKWDKIEVSDDEDDTHPNVDTPSLFRWRHTARVEREEKLKQERAEIDMKGDKLKHDVATKKGTDRKKAEQNLINWKKDERVVAEKERKQPHSVDTLSKDSASKTRISEVRSYTDYESMTMDEKEKSYSKFVEQYKKLIEEFAYFKDPVMSENHLRKHPVLVCDHTSSYLVVWCIDLEMEGNSELMKHVANQTISMQFILELAKGIQRHPADCFPLFYKKCIAAKLYRESNATKESANNKEIEYYEAFETELNSFIDRVQKRAKVKLEEQKKEEKQERIDSSPGGVDPEEVLNSLPEELQTCFVEQDVQMLQDLLAKDTKKYLPHIQQCVLSGLWVPSKDSPLHVLLEDNKKEAENEGTDNETKTEESNITEITESSNEKKTSDENHNEKLESLTLDKKDTNIELSTESESSVTQKQTNLNTLDEVD